MQLRLMLSALDEMSAKIRYGAVGMSGLLLEMAEEGTYSDCGFMRRTADGIRSGLTANEAWTTASSETPFLAEEDRQVLADIGAKLGETDTQGQISMLSLGSVMLGRALESAEEEASRKAGTLMRVWALCGIGAGILII